MAPRPYVFFDVDDTLVEWTAHWRDAFAQAAAEAGVEVSPAQAKEAIDIAFSTFYRDYVRKHSALGDERAFWLEYDGHILLMLGVKRGLEEAAERVLDLLRRPDSIRLYPEVAEVLRTLDAGGARLGIITGRPRAGPDLEALGVLHYFDVVLDAFAAGDTKDVGSPMFDRAARTVSEAGAVGWHVGDSYAVDVEGARRAGLRPVLVDRNGRHGVVDCTRVEDLRALPEIIASA